MDKVSGVTEVPSSQQDKNHATFQVLCDGRIYQLQAHSQLEMKRFVLQSIIGVGGGGGGGGAEPLARGLSDTHPQVDCCHTVDVQDVTGGVPMMSQGASP